MLVMHVRVVVDERRMTESTKEKRNENRESMNECTKEKRNENRKKVCMKENEMKTDKKYV